MELNKFNTFRFVISLNHIVVVKGLSKKGKQRIKEHGTKWRVVAFNGRMNRACLESTQTQYVRWIDSGIDQDFEVIEIIGKMDN